MAVCQNPACQRDYEKKREWQKFCSTPCRHDARNRVVAEVSISSKVINAALAWADNDCLPNGFALLKACEEYKAQLGSAPTEDITDEHNPI